jgi:hypothetical protein
MILFLKHRGSIFSKPPEKCNRIFQVKKSFTFSEILIGAAILAVVASVLILSFIACMFLNEASRNTTIAGGHAQFVIEEIKNADFDTIESRINNGDWNWDSAQISAGTLIPLSGESITTTVTPSGRLLEVEVTVDWLDRSTRARSLTVETLIASPTP